MIAIQAVINFAVVTGMVPTKGLPLPFISYGGSSLIVNMVAIGLLLNVSRTAGYKAEDQEKEFIVSDNPEDGDFSAAKQRQTNVSRYSRWSKGYGYSRYNKNLLINRELSGHK
jgi:hypothetical protein